MPRLGGQRFAPDCTIEVDGRPVAARSGESVALALVAAGRFVVARSAKYHRPRGAFCLSGSCHGCLARIDGVPNRRTCRVACRPGLVVETQNSAPGAGHDALGAIDLVFPRGLDHHHLMTWSAAANRVAVALSRQLAGTGRLPDRTPPPPARVAEERFDALVVGGGPAGLAAADVLARGGARVLLADSEGRLGGRLRCGLTVPGDPPLAWSGEVGAAVHAAGGEVCTSLTAVGLWRDGGRPVLALRGEAEGAALRVVRAPTVVVATGTVALPPLFPRNDLPGVFAGRAIARALAEDGVVPGRRCVVAGEDGDRALVAGALGSAGVAVAEASALAGALGRRRIAAVRLPGGERIRCDALVWCGPRAPASDLAREAGAEVDLAPSGGWRVRAGAAGDTGIAGIRAAGEVLGPMSAGQAAASGRAAGEAALGD